MSKLKKNTNVNVYIKFSLKQIVFFCLCCVYFRRYIYRRLFLVSVLDKKNHDIMQNRKIKCENQVLLFE